MCYIIKLSSKNPNNSSEIVQKISPPHGYFDEQIMPRGGEFDKKKFKMSNACGFARPPGGGGNK
jgi:hypothetical protein